MTTATTSHHDDAEWISVWSDEARQYVIDCPVHLLPKALEEAREQMKARAERAKAEADAMETA